MMNYRLLLCLLMLSTSAVAQNDVLDISGDNTSSDYVTYDKAISLPTGNTLDVKMARYCYFSSTISGKGLLNLYAGGERCYLGTAKGAKWADWSKYTGDVHVYPYQKNSSKAGFYGIVLAHGGKSFSPENVEDALRNGKVNTAMQNNRVTLHSGAVICTEANTAGAGFRIGELHTETGSTLQGYMKNSRAAYYLLGCSDTDGLLAGTIAPSSYRDDTPLGIIKEGAGTYRITGNNNYLSGALRIMKGSVLVNNDREEAEQKKLRGGLGARPTDSEAVAYVFEDGLLGGTGSIGGTVDNYGIIAPGDGSVGTLTIQNYQSATRVPQLVMHPASVLRFKISSADSYDRLYVAGMLNYSDMKQDFTTGNEKPLIELVLDDYPIEPGTELTLLTANSKIGDWQFALKTPTRYTWTLEERMTDSGYALLLRLVSLETPDNPDKPDNPDNPDNPVSTMGAYYDDGIDDAADPYSLRYYAKKNDKRIGAAFCTYKGYQSERDEASNQFNMLVAENEMKMDALQPSQGQFSFGSADQLVTFAQNNKMTVRGHCLVWHSQQPTWLSSDGKKNDKNWTRSEALDIMKTHISTVMQHFKGKVVEWDVVNECLDDDQSIIRSNSEGYTLRQSVWQRAIGDDYIDSAFVYAHRADSTVLLYLNDYDVEFQGKAKSVAFYNLALRLKKAGIPIDGVGLQCHFSVGQVDSTKLDNTIRRFGEAGLKCIITELDMGTPGTSAAQLEEQARQYRIITDIVLNNDNCPNMVVWGLKDNDSWRSDSNPLLYNSGMGKKPAWYAVRSALRHRTLASSDIQTVPDSQGLLGERGKGQEASGEKSAFSLHVCYDLQGRRVVNPVKGLYIVNGKLVVIK